ncbi:MAG TPA: hypothetical protein VKN18_28560 [Blastocatellia bacterium]|nr:hypothetical protein [Blastocatellia bacterium]
MRANIRFTLTALLWAVVLLEAYAVIARSQTSAGNNQRSARKGKTAQPAETNVDLIGNGTAGRISKWTGAATLGDSVISEDKFGRIGMGTTTPTSKLTVQGMIETTLGGIKFPDGTVQTTATLSGGVTVPFLLNGDVFAAPVLKVTNLSGVGAEVTGGLGGKTGLVVVGGQNLGNPAGTGISASGGAGLGPGGIGGIGMFVSGGTSELNTGGLGLFVLRGTRKDQNPAFDGYAGYFSGNVQITGNLAKGGGSFKIDHPLDPENKFLYHSFIESPDMMNIYNGNITTDASGEAVVELPSYFEALNRDFRYQLSVIGTFAQAIVAEEISNNRFTIKTSAPGVKVSWQVTGVRRDAYANKHRIPVEELKTENERGHYLYPELFNQPDEKSIEWAHHPELMQRMKEQREQTKPKPQGGNQ